MVAYGHSVPCAASPCFGYYGKKNRGRNSERPQPLFFSVGAVFSSPASERLLFVTVTNNILCLAPSLGEVGRTE